MYSSFPTGNTVVFRTRNSCRVKLVAILHSAIVDYELRFFGLLPVFLRLLGLPVEILQPYRLISTKKKPDFCYLYIYDPLGICGWKEVI